MFEVTMTHIYLPTYLWKNLPFWIHDQINEEFKNEIIIEVDSVDVLDNDNWTYVQLSSTMRDTALEYIKGIIPTFAAKVDHEELGYCLSYDQRNGDQIYSETFEFGQGESSSDINENDEDESEDGFSDASFDAKMLAIHAIEELFIENIINKFSLCLSDDEYNLIIKNIGVDEVSKAIEIVNNKKIDDIYLIACMRYIASSGVKEDVDKLNRFYIEETPVGDPMMCDSKKGMRYLEYSIISKHDRIIKNEIPGNIFLIKESEIDKFDSKGKEAITKCISSNRDYVFSSDKWFCVNRKTHINAPKWLKIKDVYFDVLISDVQMDKDGELGNYKRCNKILCNGKELQYFIVGHDRTGTQSFPNMLIMYTGDIVYHLMKERYIFDYCYCERSEKYYGSVQNQYSRYEDAVKRDLCRIDNVYNIDDILGGLANIDGVYYTDLRNIKSVSFNKKGGVIIKYNGSKIEFKLK